MVRFWTMSRRGVMRIGWPVVVLAGLEGGPRGHERRGRHLGGDEVAAARASRTRRRRARSGCRDERDDGVGEVLGRGRAHVLRVVAQDLVGVLVDDRLPRHSCSRRRCR
jgi:hypothetical protein